MGVQYTPKKNFAIIYDENEIWRYLEFRPSSILVSDNASENVIVQVYDNKKIETSSEPKLVNPFANTLTEEEKEAEQQREELVAESHHAENLEITNEKEGATPIVTTDSHTDLDADVTEFTDSNLMELTKDLLLSDKEKVTIMKLYRLNQKIISELETFQSNFDITRQDELVYRINGYMNQEKETIQNGRYAFRRQDRKKIFENIRSNCEARCSLFKNAREKSHIANGLFC